MRTVDFVTIMEEILKVPKGTLTMEDCPQTVEDWDSMAQVTLLATIDRELNDRGYILPGLGDAGDRIFGT